MNDRTTDPQCMPKSDATLPADPVALATRIKYACAHRDDLLLEIERLERAFRDRLVCIEARAVRMEYAGKIFDVDVAIAPLVKALNDAGIRTVASCSGHGFRPGRISLSDGRELMVMPSYEIATWFETQFPRDINGQTGRNPNEPVVSKLQSESRKEAYGLPAFEAEMKRRKWHEDAWSDHWMVWRAAVKWERRRTPVPPCPDCGGTGIVHYDDSHGEPRSAPCARPSCATNLLKHTAVND